MHPTDKTARVAGLLYLLSGIPAGFSLQYVPPTLIAPGKATATQNNRLLLVWRNFLPAFAVCPGYAHKRGHISAPKLYPAPSGATAGCAV